MNRLQNILRAAQLLQVAFFGTAVTISLTSHNFGSYSVFDVDIKNTYTNEVQFFSFSEQDNDEELDGTLADLRFHLRRMMREAESEAA